MSKILQGVDVSEHQGYINWELASKNIDFAILRVGYGQGHIDKQFKRNASECNKYGIPIGAYWFSYALSYDDIRREADYCCELLMPYTVELPVAFDWEYDSDNHATKYGVSISNTMRMGFANAFMNRVKEYGATPMLYTNYDYLDKGFRPFLDGDCKIWLANWSVKEPNYKFDYWQKTNTHTVPGITGLVDLNITKIDETWEDITEQSETVYNDAKVSSRLNEYLALAREIIAGKYNVGATRKKNIEKLGYDYYLVQYIVNYLMKK